MRGRGALAVVLAMVVMAAAGSALADTATSTRYYDELGRAAYARGDYRAALRAFLQVHEATPSARSAYNVGLAAHLAREKGLAFAFLEACLADPKLDPALRSEAESRVATLREQLALVRVETDPPGATIHVDRRELGSFGAAPRTIAVDPGQRSIVVTLAGHHAARVKVSAAVGEQVAAKLQLKPRMGKLLVTSEPAGAVVTAQREDLPKSGSERPASAAAPAAPTVRGTAGQPLPLPVGRYRVRIAAPGHQGADAIARVEPDKTARLRLVALPLPPKTGRLLVGTAGVQAELMLDGRPAGLTPITLSHVPVGVHTVELRAEGYVSAKREVRIEEGKAQLLAVELERPPPDDG